MARRELNLTDPRHVPVIRPNVFQRFGLSLINDERDLPFLGLMVRFGGTMIPFAAFLFLPGQFRWWLGALYTAVLFGFFFASCILMLHNTSHRKLFKPEYKVLNHVIPWVLCPFFGQPAEAYYGHHIGMHHPENNLEDDLSTTMPFQRDSFLHFLRYWGTFMVTGLVSLARYLLARNRKKVAYKVMVGELTYLSVCAAGLYFAPRPTFIVFVLPYLMARFLMMWGNWGQHAFIDPAQPENALLNSITCINVAYNQKAFNDGYHIGHHVKANRHWTEMPEDLERNAEKYAKANAIVFEGIDFFMVSLFLFLKRYDWLAARFVELREEPRSKEEIVALLKSRTAPVVRAAEDRAPSRSTKLRPTLAA